MGIGKCAPKKKGKGGKGTGKPAGTQKRAAEIDLEQEVRQEGEEHDDTKQDADMGGANEQEADVAEDAGI